MTFELDKAKGMLLGLAIGDALGTTLEFSRPHGNEKNHTEITGGGPFHLPAGTFTDDTSMALAIGASIIEQKEFDALDIMQEFWAWYSEGKYSPQNNCFDIGIATREALEHWSSNYEKPYAGSTDPQSSGNGNLMRMAPVIIYNHHRYECALVDAVRQSLITHASNECVRHAQAMAAVLFRGSLEDSVHGIELGKPYKMDDNGNPYCGGYIRETFTAACWAVRSTNSFEDALIRIVNLGYDADTTGAVTGQIAGRIYGAEAIPSRWLDKLAWREKIEEMAEKLWEMAPN